MAMVEEFDGLFEADGDEQADDDGGDVEEEVARGVDGFVGWVDVEHAWLPLIWCACCLIFGVLAVSFSVGLLLWQLREDRRLFGW
jgi:hypothetical protein